MKKAILTLAFVTAGIFAFNAAAQQPTADKQCCQAGKECYKTPAKPQRPNFFEGITLTAEQQTKIDELNKKMFEARKEAKKENKENKQNAQEAKKERKNFNEGRKKYLNEIKQILTPEQYVTYLENIATAQPQRPQARPQGHNKAKGDHKKDGKKHGKKGPQGAPKQKAQ